jgi:hypothetical protein
VHRSSFKSPKAHSTLTSFSELHGVLMGFFTAVWECTIRNLCQNVLSCLAIKSNNGDGKVQIYKPILDCFIIPDFNKVTYTLVGFKVNDSMSSVATVMTDVFHKNEINLLRKFAKFVRIFDKIDGSKNRGVI